MDGDHIAEALWFVGAFALVLSGLAVRQIKAGDMIKMAAAWVAIFAGLFLIVKVYLLAFG